VYIIYFGNKKHMAGFVPLTARSSVPLAQPSKFGNLKGSLPLTGNFSIPIADGNNCEVELEGLSPDDRTYVCTLIRQSRDSINGLVDAINQYANRLLTERNTAKQQLRALQESADITATTQQQITALEKDVADKNALLQLLQKQLDGYKKIPNVLGTYNTYLTQLTNTLSGAMANRRAPGSGIEVNIPGAPGSGIEVNIPGAPGSGIEVDGGSDGMEVDNEQVDTASEKGGTMLRNLREGKADAQLYATNQTVKESIDKYIRDVLKKPITLQNPKVLTEQLPANPSTKQVLRAMLKLVPTNEELRNMVYYFHKFEADIPRDIKVSAYRMTRQVIGASAPQ